MTPRGLRNSVAGLALGAALLFTSAPAQADEYDSQRAGHPLRIAAYALHPAGVMLDFLIFGPAHWAGSWQPIATLFGHRRNLEERKDLQSADHSH